MTKVKSASFAFFIAIVSTIAATSGYSFTHNSNSSSVLGNFISFLVASDSCLDNSSILTCSSFSFSSCYHFLKYV